MHDTINLFIHRENDLFYSLWARHSNGRLVTCLDHSTGAPEVFTEEEISYLKVAGVNGTQDINRIAFMLGSP